MTDLASLNGAHAATDTFRVCIHRGTQQIGGTCVELACRGARILLDLGLPLDAGETDPVTLLPNVPGLVTPDLGFLVLRGARAASRHGG